MSSGDAAFRSIQATARSTAAKTGVAAPTQEYLIRHVLESFLERLTRTSHADDYVLRAEFYLPRTACAVLPKTLMRTRSVPTSPLHTLPKLSVTSQMRRLMTASSSTLTRSPCRDSRTGGVSRPASAGEGEHRFVAGVALWDVSTGDPIVPAPRRCVSIESLVTQLNFSATRRRPRSRKRA